MAMASTLQETAPAPDISATDRFSIPQPYQAALAICSDLDETPDAPTYFELMRFLNTTQETSMGPGVGLEIGNTIYFDMAPGQFSYWNTDAENRERIGALIRSGHIDCLHSFGDLATTRAHAERALNELESHGCKLPVWIDHSKAPTNFGPDIMRGHGDEPNHPAYHADLTLAYGVRHVWRGRVTSVIGQNRPASLGGLFDAAHPGPSVKTIFTEAAKQALSRFGNVKYAIHGPNRVSRATTLRDGAPVCEFLRCNPHWSGVSSADTGDGIAEVLTGRFLDHLVARRGVCILYTHLGKLAGKKKFGQATIDAFRRLAGYAREKIWVTTTSRLLDRVSPVASSPVIDAFKRLEFPPINC